MMIKYRYLYTLLVLFLLLSCSLENDEPLKVTKSDLPVRWFVGYTMPEILEQNVDVKTINDIRTTLDKKWYDGFSVYSTTKPDKTFTLSSCSSLLAKDDLRLFTRPEADNSPFMAVSMMCRATQEIVNAVPAKLTFLDNIKFDKELPNKLPAPFAMILSTEESKRILSNPRIKVWSQVDKITSVEIKSPQRTIYRTEGGEQELLLVAKGDFNHDGIEDMLITSWDSVVGGSYSATRLFLVTKLSQDGDIKLLKEY